MSKNVAAMLLCVAQLTACATETPAPQTVAEALKQSMTARQKWQALAGPDASPEDLRTAAAQLEQLRPVLDQQPYLDFRSADSFMHAEPLNIALPLARIYARLDEKDKALRALESTTSVGLLPALATLKDDAQLANIRQEQRFQAVMARHQQGNIASRNSFASPYQNTLSREQRIAGLSLFWSEVRHNYANVDLAGPLDWDGLYVSYLSKVAEWTRSGAGGGNEAAATVTHLKCQRRSQPP